MKKKLLDLNDGSYTSRKFFLTLLSLIILIIITLLCVKYEPLVGLLPTFIGGLLGILSIYFTGNVATKYVHGKISRSIQHEGEE